MLFLPGISWSPKEVARIVGVSSRRQDLEEDQLQKLRSKKASRGLHNSSQR